MEHFYKTINSEDWFNYGDLYTKIVKHAKEGDHFVEVGVWKGMSACYMAVEIINSKKNIKFDCIDTWDYVETSAEISAGMCTNLYEIFLDNIKPVQHIINPIRALSWGGANYYKDNSLNFVFIDAAHDYDSVSKDLKAWYPKIKPGGIISGHDYGWEGVNRAVKEFFKDKYSIIEDGPCWLVYL